MNEEVWHRIMKEYIKNYESIKQLEKAGVIDDDTNAILKFKLLEDIIETFKSEVEE